MKKEIAFGSISLFSVLHIHIGFFHGYCTEHLFFNLSLKNVSSIATNKLKFCLSLFIILSSISLLQKIYQCFDYSNNTLFCTISQFHNFMRFIYNFIIQFYNEL